jgi:hypothetical protein
MPVDGDEDGIVAVLAAAEKPVNGVRLMARISS